MKKTFRLTSPSKKLKTWMNLKGFSDVSKSKNADIIIFNSNIGHIDPKYYGQKQHPKTLTNKKEFLRIKEMYKQWRGKKALVGIGRCSHLIHVLNGGFLYQHVTNHINPHQTHFKDKNNAKRLVETESSHTQLMGCKSAGTVILEAIELSECRQTMPGKIITKHWNKITDIEGMHYPKSNSLSWQPNPELGVTTPYFASGTDAFTTAIKQYLSY